MKLFSINDNVSGGQIIGIKYSLPNGQQKILENRISLEAMSHISPQQLACQLRNNAEQDIRRNMATTSPTNSPYAQLLGLAQGNLGNNTLMQQTAWNTLTTATSSSDWGSSIDSQIYAYAHSFPTQINNVVNKFVKFFRLAEECVITEGSKFVEPLDELRVKVAKWLNR